VRFVVGLAAALGGVVIGVAGAYLVAKRRGLDGLPDDWWRKRRMPERRLCYETKSEALQAFRDANRSLIEAWGGLDSRDTPAEYDSINARYGLKGDRAVRTLAQALWQVMPTHRPFCLDEIELDVLNATSPGQLGPGFQLPSWAHDAILEREEAAHYRQLEPEEVVPF